MRRYDPGDILALVLLTVMSVCTSQTAAGEQMCRVFFLMKFVVGGARLLKGQCVTI